jgi:hypothetical protein
MQLRVVFPQDRDSSFDEGEEVMVRSEADITKAGFAAARSVRAWLRGLPFVPSSTDLHYNVYAEVATDEEKAPASAPNGEAPRPKRKRKASK